MKSPYFLPFAGFAFFAYLTWYGIRVGHTGGINGRIYRDKGPIAFWMAITLYVLASIFFLTETIRPLLQRDHSLPGGPVIQGARTLPSPASKSPQDGPK